MRRRADVHVVGVVVVMVVTCLSLAGAVWAQPTLRLVKPRLAGWAGAAPGWKIAGLKAVSTKRPTGYAYWALARSRERVLYGTYGKEPWRWGVIRPGQRVPVNFKKKGDHCDGSWYVAPSGAYLCNTHGFTITSDDAAKDDDAPRPPAVARSLPYIYLAPKKKPVLQFERVPSKKELAAARAALKDDGKLPSVVDGAYKGGFFVALDRRVKGKSGAYYRTIAGHYVKVSEMKKVRASTLRGELLGPRARQLPMAFVYRETPMFCRAGRELRRCGVASKHARFHLAGEVARGERRFARTPGGLLVPAEALRVAKKIARPKGVGAQDKWIHFDLAQQTLVAYEGDKPVFTTLISAGKKGHETPTGTFRVYLKQLSGRMSGDDPKDGPYDIGEVPWVMYYHAGYAVHGAYWHDVFGQVRSHGCTNLAPADARWVYYWSEPTLPAGWHEMHTRSGTVLYFTR